MEKKTGSDTQRRLTDYPHTHVSHGTQKSKGLITGSSYRGFKVKGKGVQNKGGDTDGIPPIQTEVLHLLTKEFKTPKEVAVSRKTSEKAVYNIIQKLKDKGLLTGSSYRGFKSTDGVPMGGVQKYDKHFVRLHAQEFNVRILEQGDFYKKVLMSGNLMPVDKQGVRLYRDSLEVYAYKGFDFTGQDEDEASSKSIRYWSRFFHKLENRLRIVVVKDGYCNIRQVKGEFADVNNEIAGEYNVRKAKLRIFASEDGKLAFEVDESWNVGELESKHGSTAKQDIYKARKQLTDWRDNDPPTLTEVMGVLAVSVAVFDKKLVSVVEVINASAVVNRETADGLNAVVKLLQPGKDEEKRGPSEKADYFG